MHGQDGQLTAMDDPRLLDLEEQFALLDDWEDRYRYVIELGKALPALPDDARVEAAKVRGCASQVWLVAQTDPGTGLIHFAGASDAAIVQGLLAILIGLYSGRPAKEILGLDAQAAMARLGLGDALSPQRSNGLRAMALRIHEVARDQTAI